MLDLSSRPGSQIYYDDDGGEKMTEKSFFNYAGIPKNWRRISSEVLADQLHPFGSENVEAGNTYSNNNNSNNNMLLHYSKPI